MLTRLLKRNLGYHAQLAKLAEELGRSNREADVALDRALASLKATRAQLDRRVAY
jgi:outer membrane protein TolC